MPEPLCCATCSHEEEHRCVLPDPGWPHEHYGCDDQCPGWKRRDGYAGVKPGRLARNFLEASDDGKEAAMEAYLAAHKGSKTLEFCFYCGIELIRTSGAVSEHMVPSSRGGTAHRSNMGRACRYCNTQKSCLTASEYRVLLRERLGDPLFSFWGERPENRDEIAESHARLGIDPVHEVPVIEDDPRSGNWDAHVGKDAL